MFLIKDGFVYFRLPFFSSTVFNSHFNTVKLGELNDKITELFSVIEKPFVRIIVTDTVSFIGVKASLGGSLMIQSIFQEYILAPKEQVESIISETNYTHNSFTKYGVSKYDSSSSPWVFVPPRGVALVSEFFVGETVDPLHYIIIRSRNDSVLTQRVNSLRQICIDMNIHIDRFDKVKKRDKSWFKKDETVKQPLSSVLLSATMVNSSNGNSLRGLSLGVTTHGEQKDVFMDLLEPGSPVKSILVSSTNFNFKNTIVKKIFDFYKQYGAIHSYLSFDDGEALNFYRGEETVLDPFNLVSGSLSPFLLDRNISKSALFTVLGALYVDSKLPLEARELLKEVDRYDNFQDFLNDMPYSDVKNDLLNLLQSMEGNQTFQALFGYPNNILRNFTGNLHIKVPDYWRTTRDYGVSSVEHKLGFNAITQCVNFLDNRNENISPLHVSLLEDISAPSLQAHGTFMFSLNRLIKTQTDSGVTVMTCSGSLPKGLNADIMIIDKSKVRESELFFDGNDAYSVSNFDLGDDEVFFKNQHGRIEKVRLI